MHAGCSPVSSPTLQLTHLHRRLRLLFGNDDWPTIHRQRKLRLLPLAVIHGHQREQTCGILLRRVLQEAAACRGEEGKGQEGEGAWQSCRWARRAAEYRSQAQHGRSPARAAAAEAPLPKCPTKLRSGP